MGKNTAKRTDGSPQSDVDAVDANETVNKEPGENDNSVDAAAPVDQAAYEAVVAERDALQAQVDALEKEILADDGDEVTADAPAPVGVSVPEGMHAVITEAANDRLTGPQDAHFALHTIELLMGRLKTALPAAIEASDSPELKRYLETILSTL